MFRQHPSKPPTQALLGLVRDGDHARGLALSTPGQGAPDARTMLVVPARFDEDPAHQRIAHLGDAPETFSASAGVLTQGEAKPGGELATRAELTGIGD